MTAGPAHDGTKAAAGAGGGDDEGLVPASVALLAEALAGEDAETAGVRADDVLADPDQAVALLGGPDAWIAARHAVVQRYGRVGALLVMGYDRRWRCRHRAGTAEGRAKARAAGRDRLEALLEHFGELDAADLDALLAGLDGAEGLPVDDARAEARRWLDATYAVAARDGTDTAHRAYMQALDRVMRLVVPRLAS